MIEFDLEKALAGEKVITIDGREVTQLVKFNVKNDDYPLHGVLGDNVLVWQRNGRYDIDASEHTLDLFMAPKKLSGYMSISRNSNGKLYSSAVYKHKSQIDIDRETVTIIRPNNNRRRRGVMMDSLDRLMISIAIASFICMSAGVYMLNSALDDNKNNSYVRTLYVEDGKQVKSKAL